MSDSTKNKKVYLFANWKMYLDYEKSVLLAEDLAARPELFGRPNLVTAIFPSTLALAAVSEILAPTPIAIGGQNMYWVGEGGYTGEVSGPMLKAVGARYVLIGHSERRHMFNETNHEVRQKLEAALATGLTPVLCVGETGAEREHGEATEVVEAQLRAAFQNLNWPAEEELIVAYEPVWAISRGLGKDQDKHCDPAEAERMHVLIHKFISAILPGVNLVLLYGGSVRPHTIKEYLVKDKIDGALVGAASTQLDSWLEIIANSKLE